MPPLKISCISKKFVIIIRYTNIMQTNLKYMPRFSIGINPHRAESLREASCLFLFECGTNSGSGSAVN